ncbi:MAG: hypothetical protein II809_07760 [Bacteroidales bacterium]|nr:hypothetical protein [Bacteroidales bacterium]MBQ6556243.1 hypothetical protein [Bacteroidales bacterium]MBQ6821402.1 hypothetical protein [Bacteroidales bacterium]MBR0030072.1 hypothetical protein [Bacteroidales bacterium]MBR0083830.1 hypothetical protein [Bacteroidales bacterium]
MDKTWRIQDLGTWLKNSFRAILRGEFLLRLNVGRYFIHIVYTFFLIAMIIWISLMIESTMTKVEKGKAELRELEIVHTQKTFDVVKLTRRSSINEMLQQMGSKVTEPQQPATQLK